MRGRLILKRSAVLNTAVYYIKLKILPHIARKKNKWSEKQIVCDNGRIQALPLRVAFICDEMTWKNFAPQFQEAVFLVPDNWRQTLERFKPDFLFCESAWDGIDACEHAWRGRIFRNHKVMFEHRAQLLEIVRYCRNKSIPSVFWNKEDPVYYHHVLCDFADTAMYFDHIFTTAEECVEKYRKLGHKSVHVMPFGFSAQLFNPLGRTEDATGAVYTGSWFSDHPQRCRDMQNAFLWLEDKGIAVTIYDRQMTERVPSSFPAKYQHCVKPALRYEQLGEVYRHHAVGLNINTVKDSETMFARRVLEMMACALPVISNTSVGIEKRFGNRVTFYEQGGNIASDETTHDLLREVFLNDTVECRLQQMLNLMGFRIENMLPSVAVFCVGTQAGQLYEKIEWPVKMRIELESEAEIERALTSCCTQYVIVLNKQSSCPDLRFYMTQFAFLPRECGVSGYGRRYSIEKTKEYADTLWPLTAIKGNLTGEKLRYTA